MTHSKVSVLIPVHNGERYILCLERWERWGLDHDYRRTERYRQWDGELRGCGQYQRQLTQQFDHGCRADGHDFPSRRYGFGHYLQSRWVLDS